MKKTQNKDLTVGAPEKVLFRFCLPMFGSVLFQQFYNLADSLVAGKMIGEHALAAIGNSYEVTLIFLAFAFGCDVGCSVVIAQLFGAKKYTDMKTAINTCIVSVGALCGVLMLFGFLFCRDMLELIKTPSDIINDSALYLYIYIGGLPFVLFYNLANGIFSALGDSKTPFRFLAASSTANILVDILFVFLGMGVSGVAWATFLCQGVSCLLALFVLFRRLRGIQTEEKPRRFSASLLGKFARIAVPSVLQRSFISVGTIAIQGLVNGFDSASTIAGFSAATKLNSLAITVFTTIGNGVSNFTAQNLGAQKSDRLSAGFRAGVKMVLIIGVPFVIVYLIGSDMLVGMFMDNATDVAIQTGSQFLRIISPFYLIISLKLVADGILRGSGRMTTFMIATLTDLALRVLLAYALSPTFGLVGIWWSWPVGWIIATVLSLLFYRMLIKQLNRTAK